MLKYVLKRIVYIVVVFFIISIIMFTLYKSIPGDPVLMYLEGSASSMKPADYQILYERTRERLGLDQPVAIQYLRWFGNMLRGDFGQSLIYRKPVSTIILAPMGNTVKLNLVVMIFVFAITIPLGITTAVRRGSIYDNTVQVVTILGYSLPSFITSLAAILLFSIVLGWLPIGGTSTANFSGTWLEQLLDSAKYMIMPVVVMTFTSLAGLTRYIRAQMINALRMDYIRTARAKGLSEKVVIYSHAFRNCLIPFVTSLISWFLGMFGGSVVIERIFSFKGMGKLMVDSISAMDFSVALTMAMFYVILGLVGNLLIDVAYTIVDPRVRLS